MRNDSAPELAKVFKTLQEHRGRSEEDQDQERRATIGHPNVNKDVLNITALQCGICDHPLSESDYMTYNLILFSPIVFPMGMTAQTCSVYFTIFAGADCFAQVCLPDKVKNTMAQTKFIRRSVIFIFIFSVLYNIPHCFEAIVIDCFHETLGGSSWEILVVLLFIACNVAALLLNTFEAKIVEAIGPYINYIVDLSNLLVVFNSSFNFIIYITFSRSFRETLRKYLYGHDRKEDCDSSITGTEKSARSIVCKETFGRLLATTQPEVLI
ncbi:hypothetical protein ANCCEY_06028 [Ancylostoma ceylanicum]|uniref:G-protein coupled receptors family 1 profile domain-containing protein n=1 Tax=Ancylostoma ceylanicum TaxID=53326 RepID=A0A0D6LUM2_9BILA|nr:hypothetical protein ANCCEY_06028 [Ancylostoma ceylanicum]